MAGERRPNPDFWRGRSVFLTGHTGFIGGWLALWLTRMGARVVGYSLQPPTEPNFFDCVGLKALVSGTIGDVRNREQLEQAVASARPEILLHLAAQPLIGVAFQQPYATFTTNVLGTLNALEALRKTPSIKAVIVFTTDKVYLERGRRHQEEAPLGGQEPYALSKASAEFAVRAYRQSQFSRERPDVGLVTVRAGNIVGGGDWAPRRLVPDAMRAFQAGQTLLLRMPHAVRPWQFVLDAVSGLLLLAEAACRDPRGFSGAWNFGPVERAVATVAEVADALALHWGFGASWRKLEDSCVPETSHLEIDSSKAVTALGWRPHWPLEAAVSQSVAWYRSYYDDQDVADITGRQIEEHVARQTTRSAI